MNTTSTPRHAPTAPTPASALDDPARRFWRRWLQATAAGLLAFGLVMVLLPAPTQAAFNLMIFGQRVHPASFSADAVRYLSFTFAVLGAVMAGWAVMMLAVLAGPWRSPDPAMARQAWWMLVLPLAVWFVPDTIASLAWGYWPNAVLNTVVTLGFAVPLVATRPR